VLDWKEEAGRIIFVRPILPKTAGHIPSRATLTFGSPKSASCGHWLVCQPDSEARDGDTLNSGHRGTDTATPHAGPRRICLSLIPAVSGPYNFPLIPLRGTVGAAGPRPRSRWQHSSRFWIRSNLASCELDMPLQRTQACSRLAVFGES
jgi:hypothetical protein